MVPIRMDVAAIWCLGNSEGHRGKECCESNAESRHVDARDVYFWDNVQ